MEYILLFTGIAKNVEFMSTAECGICRIATGALKMSLDLNTIEAVKTLCMLKFYTGTLNSISDLGNIHFDWDGAMQWV
jgi:hypothetical protein